LKIAVFWDVASCSLIESDEVSEALAASIIVLMTAIFILAVVRIEISRGLLGSEAALFLFVIYLKALFSN
jgi:hypothetical protein